MLHVFLINYYKMGGITKKKFHPSLDDFVLYIIMRRLVSGFCCGFYADMGVNEVVLLLLRLLLLLLLLTSLLLIQKSVLGC